ncbi:AAA family ATPase [Rhizobium sp. DKSPLA3]|uniref:AAA family ATPase n=1 Tax=Rhizobium quercicola TaxID=2901226 RepID=A0A9X1NTJ0_9HYPH|nr:AAA family ATPase [Rhizobium quercicola]MCD7109726.1 AAA family ATPase [Rhizobium quercicola]
MARIPAIDPYLAKPSFDEDAVRGHVEMLHKLSAGLAGLLVVSTFYANPAGDKDVPGVVTHHRVGDVNGMVEAILCHAETPNVNVFAGLQVMRPDLERGKRGTESDILALLGLVVDLDADTGHDGSMPIDPHLVLETSPGNRQPFVLFDRPVAPAEAKPLAAALKRATGSDHGTADIAHVWRISGTLNFPNRKKLERGRSADPARVFVLEEWQGDFVSVEDLRTALEPWAGEVREASSFSMGELPVSGSVRAGDRAAGLLAACDVGDRSNHAARVVEQLAFDGHSPEVALFLFLNAPGDWLTRYPTEDRATSDFRRLWGKFAVPLIEEREQLSVSVSGFLDRVASKPPLVAANDNKPPVLSIFDWTVDRFVGTAPAVQHLVEGAFPLAVPGMVSAMGDTGKSYAILELHRRVSFGSSPLAPPVFGGRVVAEGTSVMITSEDDQNEVHRRVAALDERDYRSSSAASKMIVVPLPSAGGARAFWRDDRKNGLQETDDFKRICDQLKSINDLRLVTFDPLASFAHLALNEDPAAGQFVCTSLSKLAAETGATVLVAHHMRKVQKPIETLGDARDAIRGSTAIVDGLRVAYAMWPAEEARARKVCKELGVPFMPGKVVLGGIVKANGAARRIVSTYVRNEFGLLIDATAGLGARAPVQADLLAAMTIAIEGAAANGQPFTKTGATGVFEMKDRLSGELKGLSRHRLEKLVEGLLESGAVVSCLATGTATKWLDVPGGQFAIGLGNFRKGASR